MADVSENQMKLWRAAREDLEDVLDEVFENGDYDLDAQNEKGLTALHLAAQNTSIWVIEKLVDKIVETDGDIDPVAGPRADPYTEGDTPLHIALAQLIRSPDKGKIHIVAQLINAGADTDKEDHNGVTGNGLLEKLQAQDEATYDELESVINEDADEEDEAPPVPARRRVELSADDFANGARR
ncbi:hypothetical protein CONPUDRAFT_141496 [Coniophora puteana RWD-64-598 SS2]|uniref:Uncharacterized protein n=1 Tax=Coniophora puteana (strain RWD-64-598) TaxID=741705 RepID=A0A5M3N7R3_CONPW|nr:uncharacterized protein CONPUDRAFT_141496 [Coniophora puteana RWD-64-598 SS2]EIW87346.1 hypothetical protein CONPUDRAFT_141496 [Coniophora puteana RWD-64-598 SS2]